MSLRRRTVSGLLAMAMGRSCCLFSMGYRAGVPRGSQAEEGSQGTVCQHTLLDFFMIFMSAFMRRASHLMTKMLLEIIAWEKSSALVLSRELGSADGKVAEEFDIQTVRAVNTASEITTCTLQQTHHHLLKKEL